MMTKAEAEEVAAKFEKTTRAGITVNGNDEIGYLVNLTYENGTSLSFTSYVGAMAAMEPETRPLNEQ